MLGAPIDAWYVWFAASVAALAVLGVAVAATPEPPARADAAATAVETVAASEPPAAGRHPIGAERVRVTPHRIDVVGDGHPPATVAGDPLTPARRGTPLRRVALGEPPSAAFDSPTALEAAARDARAEPRVLTPAGDHLIVRSLRWGEVDVTLVAA